MSEPRKRSKRKSRGSTSGLLSQLANGQNHLGAKALEEAAKKRKPGPPTQASKISSTRNREQGAAHEKSMGGRHRMEETRGSGCGKKEKGDTKDDTWCGEGKSTRGKSISVTEDILDKAWRDGKHMGKIPFIDLDFCKAAKTRRPRHWVLVPGPVFQLLKDRLTDEEKELLRP